MTPISTDAMTGTTDTDALLTAPDTADMTDGSLLLGESPRGRSSERTRPGGRDRIQRFTGMLHKAIDKVDQGLGARNSDGLAQGASGTRTRFDARTLGQQITARPLRSAGIALGAYVLLRKLLKGSPQVQTRYVEVPVPARSPRVRASALARSVNTVPTRVRYAADGLRVKGRSLGNAALYGVQSHPVAGLGTVAGASALLTLWLSRRRRKFDEPAYLTSGSEGLAFRGASRY